MAEKTREEYDEDAINRLIDAALGVSRVLQDMSYDTTIEAPLAAAYSMMHDALWRAVEGVAGDPMEIAR